MESDQKLYNQIKSEDESFSFKLEYRKGQSCLNLYHSMLEKSSRKLPWEEIHDNYDNVYYFPNTPYWQFKGKNKNIYIGNKKPVYRRYVLNEWSDEPSQDQADKDQNRRKFEKQATALKLNEVLNNAQKCFKKSLLLLEREESLTVKVEGAEADLTKTVNQYFCIHF